MYSKIQPNGDKDFNTKQRKGKIVTLFIC